MEGGASKRDDRDQDRLKIELSREAVFDGGVEIESMAREEGKDDRRNE